jgi:hypothetical protein
MTEPKRKNPLKSLLHQNTAAAPINAAPAAPSSVPPAGGGARGGMRDPYPLSTLAAPHLITLPPDADALSGALQEIARNYLSARRRTGESLLDAARWLSDARELAAHGDWLTFLRITGTSPDSAEQLLHIHARATAYPQFADAIRSGWLNQTTAALAAKPSTPVEVIATVLDADAPPTVADVQRARRDAVARAAQPSGEDAAQNGASQIPIKSVFDPTQIPIKSVFESAPAWLAPLCAHMAQTAGALRQAQGAIARADDETAAMLSNAVEELLREIDRTAQALEQRSGTR